MSLSFKERVRIATLAAERSRRSAVARVLASPLLRWRYGSGLVDHLLIVPQDLRTADPSFWREIEHGHFGLAGTIAVLDGASPFSIVPPNLNWARELHGFGWLRHLGATGEDMARDFARKLAIEWSLREMGRTEVSTEAVVAARRLMSWISNANLLLDGSDTETYETLTASLGRQLVQLSAAWRDAPYGYPRLLSLTALVLADLAIAGHDRQLKDAEAAFGAEITRQIMPDGGHISRNPSILIELLLDFLPLSQCFTARGRPAPEALGQSIRRMLAHLRFLRLGDGMLARFNGMGVPSPAGLATVLAYDDGRELVASEAPQSRYTRMQRGPMILLADVGPPPPLEASGDAQSGCLAFELSVGSHLLFANGGMPGPADSGWLAAARATASHNTLCLAEQSSSRLVEHKRLQSLVGAQPIRGPDRVVASLTEIEGGLELEAEHDGYVKRFGLVHHRRLTLSEDGLSLTGHDHLRAPGSAVRLPRDLPFSVHFHLHPSVVCRHDSSANSAKLTLPDGRSWTFASQGIRIAIEESTYFADSAGPVSSLQIILRGTTFGDSEVKWDIKVSD